MKLRNGLYGLAFALSTSCGGDEKTTQEIKVETKPKVDRVAELLKGKEHYDMDVFLGTFKDPASGEVKSVVYVSSVFSPHTGRPSVMDVWSNDNSRERVARFKDAAAESLYTRLFPETLSNYRAESQEAVSDTTK